MSKTTENLDSIVREVMRRGPDRVVIDDQGTAVGPRQARELHNIRPTIIFIRNDGWTLAAPSHLEAVAYRAWPDQWIGFLIAPDQTARQISEYR